MPPYLVRMQAEDLVAAAFPDQLACLENIVGDRQIPDHPLVFQTIQDCLTEAMDIERLVDVIAGIESGRIRVVARDLVEPSPLAAEIVNSRVYTFLDGAPLEERRTRAVANRRWLDPASAADLGRLDQAAIDNVREEAWPEAADKEELHDALNLAGYLVEHQETPPPWPKLFEELAAGGRATRLRLPTVSLWLAAERLPLFEAIHPNASFSPPLLLPEEFYRQTPEKPEALADILRARLSISGPVVASRLASELASPEAEVDAALIRLETEGVILRGQFTPHIGTLEWCDRRLLARIHRYTINRLRKEIEPVSSAEFLRFLFRWQRVLPETRGEGPAALAEIVEQLEGFETAAVAWESDILISRINAYDPGWLDGLCLSGRVVWSRLSAASDAITPVKASPIAFVARKRVTEWQTASAAPQARTETSGGAARVLEVLNQRGASFFEELAEHCGLLGSQLEAALAELAVRGLAHSDSFKGLRALLVPEDKKRRWRGVNPFGIEESGRWSAIHRPLVTEGEARGEKATEQIARILLKRYGVVFKALLARETTVPPWRDLLWVYRGMEARGELRGGRFVAGHFGEQFALPDAVESLRAIRRIPAENEICAISAADPLNLVGIITPGAKLPALPGNRVLYRAGIPLAVLSGKETRFLARVDERDEWALKNQLVRRHAPPPLRAYL